MVALRPCQSSCRCASFESFHEAGSQPRHEPHASELNLVSLMQIDAK